MTNPVATACDSQAQQAVDRFEDAKSARLVLRCLAGENLSDQDERQLDSFWSEGCLNVQGSGQEGLDYWLRMVESRDPAEHARALAAINEARSPESEFGQPERRTYATLADAVALIGETRWFWPSWIPAGAMTLCAAKGGVGKTRMAMDLARRLWRRLPMPDGADNPCPSESRTLWILVDRNWGETADVARSFGVPLEAIYLNSTRDAPLTVPELDDPNVMADLVQQIRDQQPALVVVDTITYATARNTAKAEEAKAAFDAILQMAADTGVPVLALAHLNKEGEVLNRRITERARSVISLTCPDPEGQPDRRKVWVSKTAVKAPPALGATNTSEGFEYDNNPPSEPEQERKPKGKTPSKSLQDAEWLWNELQAGEVYFSQLVGNAKLAGVLPDREGVSTSPLYNALRRIPDIHPGWRVDDMEIQPVGGRMGGRARKAWKLVQDSPATIPFESSAF